MQKFLYKRTYFLYNINQKGTGDCFRKSRACALRRRQAGGAENRPQKGVPI